MTRRRKTHCKRGHEYTVENTIVRAKGRECRICKNANHKVRYNRFPKVRKRMLEKAAAYRARVKQRHDTQTIDP